MTLRAILTATFFAVQPAIADELILDTSRGLASLQSELSDLSTPRAVDSVALGAASFLRALEKSLQERYRTNAGPEQSLVGIPILRLPLPTNPEPEPFQPESIAALFASVDADMDQARDALAAAKLGPEDKVIIDVATLWLDINGDEDRNAGEGVLEFAGMMLADPFSGAQTEIPSEGLVVHFDAADVEWLVAYTHLLSAVSEVVLAFDPTDVITDVMASSAAMAKIQDRDPWPRYLLSGSEGFVDTIAMVYGALNRVPDKTRIGSARDHLLAMIRQNRAFWALVYEETDNAFEWIPNPSQEAALGFSLPDDTGAVWQEVLADAEAVLKGELLVPHWRTDPGGGINVAALVDDPPAFDIVTWVQGAGLVPYMEKGPLVSFESFARFDRMLRGDAILFMVLLN